MCIYTFAVTIWPSLSILSIVAVGKKGRMSRNDLTRYLYIRYIGRFVLNLIITSY